MATLTGLRVLNYAAGDTWRFDRSYGNIPLGVSMSKVYFTVKSSPIDADPGVIQVSITSSPGVSGQITKTDSSPDGIITFNLIVNSASTSPLNIEKGYYYDFQGIGSDTKIYTFETGLVRPVPQITLAIS